MCAQPDTLSFYLIYEGDAAADLRVEYPERLVPLDQSVELAVARVHRVPEGVAGVGAREAAVLLRAWGAIQ